MASASPETDAAVRDMALEFERWLERLAASRPFAKGVQQTRLVSLARKLLQSDAGIEVLYGQAHRFDAAGLFTGGDWDQPELLQAALARGSLTGEGDYPVIECLSALRFLAIARGEASHATLSSAAARAYLEDVLARNLDLLFPEATEQTRDTNLMDERVRRLLAYLLEHLGAAGIVEALAVECERVLLQRPIMLQRVEDMLRTASRIMTDVSPETPGYEHARWLIASLDAPTALMREHDSNDAYREALAALSDDDLRHEAAALGERMDKTGLVSHGHATLLRHVAVRAPELLPESLALNRIGKTSLAEYTALVRALIGHAVTPATARCIYGLSRLLNRGILFFQPVAPGLQRLMVCPIASPVAELLQRATGLAEPPPADVLLLAGTLSVIGQPRGMDQGHNPTCQAARAISLWSQNDVGYLLELITLAVRDNDLSMHFEGDEIRSSELTFGLAAELHTELDPVSLVLTPHLDKLYMDMSRRTIGRGDDGHRWVNPEFHGWWVYRDFASVIDQATEGILQFERFVRLFYAAYHPEFNGGRDLVYAQPCGVVSTSPAGEFIGWHAVSIERVACDSDAVWRVYFFNPNRDKGQDWGQGIVTSTSDHGEWEGESSLPFEQFLMRLYVFHYKSGDIGNLDAVPADSVATIRSAVAESWATDRDWLDAQEPAP